MSPGVQLEMERLLVEMHRNLISSCVACNVSGTFANSFSLYRLAGQCVWRCISSRISTISRSLPRAGLWVYDSQASAFGMFCLACTSRVSHWLLEGTVFMRLSRGAFRTPHSMGRRSGYIQSNVRSIVARNPFSSPPCNAPTSCPDSCSSFTADVWMGQPTRHAPGYQ